MPDFSLGDVVRTAKIAIIEAVDATRLGRIRPAQFRQVAGRLAHMLGDVASKR